MVGTVGQILGDAGVNIAGMQVSRDGKGGKALVALSVDSAVPADVLEQIRTAIDAESVRGVDLSESLTA
jgi:D-3-phosphoglycerate dehydrogenase